MSFHPQILHLHQKLDLQTCHWCIFDEKNFLKKTCGVPQLKNSENVFWDPKILIYISVDAVFNGDHENHNYILFGRMHFENTIKKVSFLGTISFLLGQIKVLRAYFLDIFLCTTCAVFFALSNSQETIFGPNIFWYFFSGKE